MRWEDPIVKEVRDIRDKIAAEHHYDIREIARYYRKKQAQETRPVVKNPARPLPGHS